MRRAAEDGLKGIAKKHGMDLRYGPGVAGNGPKKRYEIILDYGKPTSRGYLGVGEWTEKQLSGPSGVREVTLWNSLARSDDHATRARAAVRWDGTKWRLVQLFPDAAGLNPVAGRYATSADVYLRR